MSENTGKYTQIARPIPLAGLFTELRDQWIMAKEGRSSASLARRLDVKAQRVSQWATGSDPSRGVPPWWVILTICEDLNVEVRINADEVLIARRRRDANSRAKVIR